MHKRLALLRRLILVHLMNFLSFIDLTLSHLLLVSTFVAKEVFEIAFLHVGRSMHLTA